jgi:dTDP-4-amino-4,6-dideoxygalactose transaminase
MIGAVPRRSVNLPPGTLKTLLSCILGKRLCEGPELEAFHRAFGQWLGAPHVFGTAMGRSAFQLALEALDLEKGSEIIVPCLTFPVMPMVIKMYGYQPVFCDVDPDTFNAGPEQIRAKLTAKTRGILATHLFGQPCPIEQIAALAREHDLCLMEDCAHACGVRVNGKQVGTFGDIGIYSFAEGKNMPCLGGGAIATADERIAGRARDIMAQAPFLDPKTVRQKGLDVWIKWLVTRPAVFGASAYPALRMKLRQGQPLMDSAVGDELLDTFTRSDPKIVRLSNLQAAVGLRQLEHIDAFNEGARRNAQTLTEALGEVPGVKAPRSLGADHIYVYYPLTVDPDKRDDLRHYLLRHGIDTKLSDMGDCRRFRAFQGPEHAMAPGTGPNETSILEICVYPVIPQSQMRKIGRVIREWAGVA